MVTLGRPFVFELESVEDVDAVRGLASVPFLGKLLCAVQGKGTKHPFRVIIQQTIKLSSQEVVVCESAQP
jgi:hypothetical protein